MAKTRLTTIEFLNGYEISELAGRFYVYSCGEEFGFASIDDARKFIIDEDAEV